MESRTVKLVSAACNYLFPSKYGSKPSDTAVWVNWQPSPWCNIHGLVCFSYPVDQKHLSEPIEFARNHVVFPKGSHLSSSTHGI